MLQSSRTDIDCNIHKSINNSLLSLKNINDLEKAKPWIVDSLKRIEKAVINNEPTGYYANVRTIDEE